jgi:hypothetical protein
VWSKREEKLHRGDGGAATAAAQQEEEDEQHSMFNMFFN